MAQVQPPPMLNEKGTFDSFGFLWWDLSFPACRRKEEEEEKEDDSVKMGKKKEREEEEEKSA